MQQHELRQPAGATHKKKRVGRGNASGHGTYSTKGLKGQKARSGVAIGPWSHSSRVSFRQCRPARVNPALVSLSLRGRRSKLPASKADRDLGCRAVSSA